MRVAQILNNRIHFIFDAEVIPNWPPDPDGNPIILINITGKQADEGDDYNSETGDITPYSETSS